MNNQRLKINADIGLVLAYLICFFSIQCSDNAFFLFAVTVLWLIIAFLQRPETFHRELLSSDCGALYLFLFMILVLCSLLGSLTNGIGNSLRYLSLFCGGLIFRYYRTSESKLKKLVIVTGVCWLFYTVKSILFFEQNPGAARLIISHQRDAFSSFPIGRAYGLTFGSVIVGTILLILLLSKKISGIKRLGCVIGIGLSFFLCVKTESTLTIMIFIVGCTVSVIYRNSTNKTRKFVVTLFVLAIFVLLLFLKGSIGLTLISWNPTGVFNIDERVHEIGKALAYSDYSGVALGGRIEAYFVSINTIFRNPLLGSIFTYGYPTSVGISGHSELLDVFALYGGIVGITFIIWYKNNIHSKNYNSTVSFFGCEICCWLLIIVNQFAYTAGSWFMFFLLPAVKYLMFLNEQENMC